MPRRSEWLKAIGLALIIASLYYFWKSVDLVSVKKPYFISSLISLLVGLILVHYGLKLVEKALAA